MWSPLRASSDHSPSSFSLEGGLDWSPTARSFFTRPPTDTPRRAINPGEGLPRPRVARAQETIKLHLSLFQTPTKGSGPGCPLLRASDEHILIVRVLRARRTVWLLPSHPSEGGYPLLNFSVYHGILQPTPVRRGHDHSALLHRMTAPQFARPNMTSSEYNTRCTHTVAVYD